MSWIVPSGNYGPGFVPNAGPSPAPVNPSINTPYGPVDPTKLGNFSTPPPAHVQFFFNTIGQVVFRAIGRVRLPGQILWAQGINASGDLLTSSFCTFASVYCAPIIPGENVSITRMWSFGTLIYDINNGGVIPPGNVDDTTVAYLETCLSNIVIYPGDEAQLPDPLIQTDKGADVTPAYRGFRYIVFPQFPLLVANNAVPNVNVEWTPNYTTPLNFSSIMILIGALQGLTVKCEGIPDVVDNFICTTDESFQQIAQRHRALYNYQIIDRPDGSILLSRRQLTSSIFQYAA
jgi:hypothetical protein